MQKINLPKIFFLLIATLFLFSISVFLPSPVSALEENFNTLPLNSEIWQVYQNEGLLNIENGALQVSAENTATFPFIHSTTNSIPLFGDFSVRFRMKYNKATTKGSGLTLATEIPPNGGFDPSSNDPVFSRRYFLQIWQDSLTGFYFQYTGDCYNQGCSFDQVWVWQKGSQDLDYHTIEFQYINNRYLIFLDRTNIFTSNPTEIRPTALWFGNPSVQGSGDMWTNFEIDYIHITTTPSPSPIPLPVPYLSQNSEPWGSQEYNHAQNWASNPTIARWGCALTSAAMTLLYHEINQTPNEESLTPETLNNWLKNQIDGYLREGYLNWYALTRLARLVHNQIGSTLLEFRRTGRDFTILDNDLDNNQPPILEVPGHFIVATGKTDGSWFINDPAWEERETLDSYGNDFNSLRRLLPTSTDLSAFLAVADPNVDFLVTDENGNQVGQSFLENPLIDDIDGNQTNGEGIRIFDLPTPPPGDYKIQVEGDGQFTVDLFLYDKNAIPSAETFFGFTSEDNPAQFEVSISEEGGGELIRTTTFARTKEDIQESLQAGLITNQGIAKVLLAKITIAEWLKNHRKIKATQIILKDFLRELEIFKNRFIKPEAYILLKQDGEYLLSHL